MLTIASRAHSKSCWWIHLVMFATTMCAISAEAQVPDAPPRLPATDPRPTPEIKPAGYVHVGKPGSSLSCGKTSAHVVEVKVPADEGPKDAVAVISASLVKAPTMVGYQTMRLYQLSEAECKNSSQSVRIQKRKSPQGPFITIHSANLSGKWVGCPKDGSLCENCKVLPEGSLNPDTFTVRKPGRGTDVYRVTVMTKVGDKVRQSCVSADWQTPPR
jgi:hypothetical protein